MTQILAMDSSHMSRFPDRKRGWCGGDPAVSCSTRSGMILRRVGVEDLPTLAWLLVPNQPAVLTAAIDGAVEVPGVPSTPKHEDPYS
jgi:hypothetical protein